MSNAAVETETVGVELATLDAVTTAGVLESFESGTAAVYSSFKGSDFTTRKAVISAMMSAESVADELDKPFKLANFVIQEITLEDMNTGQPRKCFRTVLVDDKGKARAAVSDGVVKALQTIVGVLGVPGSWPEAVPVKVTQKTSRKGLKFFTIELV